MASLANNSDARRWRVPAGTSASLLMFVLSMTSPMPRSASTSTSISPFPGLMPRNLGTDGATTSASTSRTVLSTSMAMLIARLSATKVFPSPGNALVTMMRLPFARGAPDFPSALRISGRLMTRNSCANCTSGALGVMIPLACSRPKSMLTRLGPAAESADQDGSDRLSRTSSACARSRPARVESTAAWACMPALPSCSSRLLASSMMLMALSERGKAADKYDRNGEAIGRSQPAQTSEEQKRLSPSLRQHRCIADERYRAEHRALADRLEDAVVVERRPHDAEQITSGKARAK